MESVVTASKGVNSQGKVLLTNLIFFHNKVAFLVDQGKPENVMFLMLAQILVLCLHSILLDKMAITQIDKSIASW